MEEIARGKISSRSFSWIFDLCVDRHIDPQRILKYVYWTREKLADPGTFIDWDSFLTLFSNLGNYFSEEQLIEAGASSWEGPGMLAEATVGRLSRSSRAQFEAIYGETGSLPRASPFAMRVRDVKRGHLEIRLEMESGLVPCRVFQILLAGQMSGLTMALGEPEANVHINHTARGATYDVWFQPIPGPISLTRRLLRWPATIRDSARLLTAAEDAAIAQAARTHQAGEAYKALEQHARENELRYKVLEHNVKDVIVTMDTNLGIHYISASVQGLCGYTAAEVLAMRPGMLFTEPSLARIREFISRQQQAEGQEQAEDSGKQILEIEMYRKSGSRIWTELQINSVTDADGHRSHLIGVISDISERKFFEENLSEREASYRAITTTAQDAIITVNEHNTITFANPAASRIFDYEPAFLAGRPLTELMPGAVSGVRDADAVKTPYTSDSIPIEGLRRDGSTLALEASFAEHQLRGRRYTTWIIRDVTARFRSEQERMHLEQQLQAVQRMESIGQLTGGIAHDFNNLLVAINGYADLALAQDLPPEKLEQYIAEIRRAGERAADMTHKLLAFSRQQIIERSQVDVNQLIKGLEKMIVRLLPENIHVKYLPALQNPAILADAGQIEQVLVNLAVNARDAMPEGGRLTISIDQKDASSLDFADKQSANREYAVIRVEDTGHGMSEAVRKRIFEPFFTTKSEGEGTGLGMSVAFGIVKQHEGYIDVSSQPSRGTRFEVYLPVAEARLPPVKKEKHRAEAEVIAGSETILLVEDNSQVRDLARLILVGAGYQVIEAQDGIEALGVFEQQMHSISLVIMDVVMPRMGGKDVMSRLREIKPDIKILFTSGYSSGGIHTNFILEEGLDFIQKPYDADALRARVRYVLDDNGRDGGMPAPDALGG